MILNLFPIVYIWYNLLPRSASEAPKAVQAYGRARKAGGRRREHEDHQHLLCTREARDANDARRRDAH